MSLAPNPPALTAASGDVPTELISTVTWMLARLPEDRPSAQQVAEQMTLLSTSPNDSISERTSSTTTDLENFWTRVSTRASDNTFSTLGSDLKGDVILCSSDCRYRVALLLYYNHVAWNHRPAELTLEQVSQRGRLC